MKVIEIGKPGSYDDLRFTESKKCNKYGSLYYFKDRIYLVKKKPITGYSTWMSDDGVAHLIIDGDAELYRELRLICEAIQVQSGEKFDFKELKDDERLFLKTGKDCGKIAPNCELTYCILVYGFFKKGDRKAFLQMDICEHVTKKISLLEGAAAFTKKSSSLLSSKRHTSEKDSDDVCILKKSMLDDDS